MGGLRLTFGPKAARASEIEKDVLYFHADQLGSTRLVTRGSDGSVYSYNNYLPFGKMLEGQTMGGEILPDYALFKNSYTGQEADRTTGLYFYQSRFYDADLGRFTQADTVVPRPLDTQTFNRYTYVNNNPFKFTDPTGHLLLEAIVIAVITYFAIIAITNIVTGYHITPTGEGIARTIGMAIFCYFFPGVGFIISCLSLFQSIAAAAQGDKAAMVNVVVSLVMMGYSVVKYIKQSPLGYGTGSPTNGENKEYTQEDIKDLALSYGKKDTEADPYPDRPYPIEIEYRTDWRGTGDKNYFHIKVLATRSDLSAAIAKVVTKKAGIAFLNWCKDPNKISTIFKVLRKAWSARHEIREIYSRYERDQYFFDNAEPCLDRAIYDNAKGWYSTSDPQFTNFIEANEQMGNFYDIESAMESANKKLGHDALRHLQH